MNRLLAWAMNLCPRCEASIVLNPWGHVCWDLKPRKKQAERLQSEPVGNLEASK